MTGIPGPPPKPTRIKELNGNPGQRPLNKDEPKPRQGAPKPPPHLTGEALAEWGRIVPELDRIGLLTKVDRAYLIAYCEAWATFDEARQQISRDGILVPGRGGMVRNPAAFVMKDAADMMLKFGSRFGLSPSDRTRLSVESDDDGEEATILSLLSNGTEGG